MSGPDDKGKFSTNIGQELIDAAMKSVDKAHQEVTGEAPPVDLELEPQTGEAAAPTEEADALAAADAAPPRDKRDVELDELRAQLDHSLEHGRNLMGKLKDEHERLLRATADLENYKKRAQREKEETQKFGSEKLLKDFVPIYDNFDRALEAARSSDDFDSLKKGVEMMKKLFEDTLGKHAVKVFSAKGQPFDPNRHEAMSQEITTEVPPNHVAREVLKGFTLNERLIRPALVVVSAAPPAGAAAPSEATDTPADAPEGEPGGPTES